MDLQLTGKRVLVTGGTRGIGRAIVAAFLKEGAVVGFCARNPEDTSTTEEALRGLGGWCSTDVCGAGMADSGAVSRVCGGS